MIDPMSGEAVDPRVDCTRCEAVCCRLTVVLMPDDHVPDHLTARSEHGLEVMARDEDGWCAAIDPLHLKCSIYTQRPTICRAFAMGGAQCVEVRETYRDQRLRGIPIVLE